MSADDLAPYNGTYYLFSFIYIYIRYSFRDSPWIYAFTLMARTEYVHH
jgi:hypothetical protein